MNMYEYVWLLRTFMAGFVLIVITILIIILDIALAIPVYQTYQNTKAYDCNGSRVIITGRGGVTMDGGSKCAKVK